jgi:threonine/homoserine/homoserine lactone efflux protein
MVIIFAQGFGVGVMVAAAVGPITLLCLRRALIDGFAAGLASGLGVAAADALFGAIAAFGLTFAAGALEGSSRWLGLVAGMVLIGLGFALYRAPARESRAAISAAGLAGAFATTLVLTLANPMTILSFAAIFAGLELAGTQAGYAGATVLVAGVFAGSIAWWLALIGAVGLIRERITPALLAGVNRVTGVIVVLFGLAVLLRAVLLADGR